MVCLPLFHPSKVVRHPPGRELVAVGRTESLGAGKYQSKKSPPIQARKICRAVVNQTRSGEVVSFWKHRT